MLFGLFFVLLVLAGARVLYLGGPHAGALRRAARTQQLTNEVVPAERGTITDRNGVALAISEPAQELTADPYLIKRPLAAAQHLAPLLGLTQAQVLTKLSEHTGFVYLAHALPYNAAHKALALKLPGVEGAPVMRRVYPRGTLAAQVLGIVGTEHEGAGRMGLEYSLNSTLARARRTSPRCERRNRTAGLDRRNSPRAGGGLRVAHARCQHPAAS